MAQTVRPGFFGAKCIEFDLAQNRQLSLRLTHFKFSTRHLIGKSILIGSQMIELTELLALHQFVIRLR